MDEEKTSDEAAKAKAGAEALFSAATPGSMDNVPTAVLAAEDFNENGEVDILTILVKAGLEKSRGDARRDVQQGGVTVDGVKHTYKKVWLAPTMNGRCYGGGMMPTPDQDRLDPERKLSVLVYHGVGKLRALIVFPSIFKGEHLKHDKMCEVLTGHEITVEFDRPTALQIDGETVKNVTSYKAVK